MEINNIRILAIAGLISLSTGAWAKDVSAADAEESLIKARVTCQSLTWDSPQCIKVLDGARYVDQNVMSLCLSKPFDKLVCLQRSLNKFYRADEVNACKDKTHEFLSCVASLGSVVRIVNEENELSNEEIRRELSVARTLLDQGRYGEAYRVIYFLEEKLK